MVDSYKGDMIHPEYLQHDINQWIKAKGENMDDNFNYWVNQYHDTDKEVYREILFSEMIDSKKKCDDELFTVLAKLHQRLYEATTEEEIIKVKQEYHSLYKGD